jgi:hypothetical protein
MRAPGVLRVGFALAAVAFAATIAGCVGAPPPTPVTSSEMDAIRSRVERFWNVPAGAREAGDLVVRVVVSLDADGRVLDVRVDPNPSQEGDPYYQKVAESVLRATRMASPLPVPAGKFDQLKTIVLAFHPQQMVKGK